MKQELSILIPIYNGICYDQVQALCRQADAIDGLRYEILVADDGSSREDCLAANRPIGELACCRFIERGFNSGRAVIRNFLAHEARYEWLLFLDGDMTITQPQLLLRYFAPPATTDVVYGGYTVGTGSPCNLRYRYEKAAEARHTAQQRQKQPYRDFHTSNFLIRRSVMLQHPFDERFRHYGYEDVLLGKQLRQAGIAVLHIDNPVGFNTFETNLQFVEKTEEGLRTLHEFRHDLRGYNGLLTLVGGIHLSATRALIRFCHRLLGPLTRRLLCSNHPSLTLFKLYKLGYYLTLTKNDSQL